MAYAAFLFDLDMTLVDSVALGGWREQRVWGRVRDNMDKVRPFPARSGVAPHELPGLLKAMGHPVAIVTSSPRWYAERIVGDFNIAYDVLVAYGDTAEHKPDPEPITKALSALGCALGEAYHVGDDPIDVEASYHAGVTSIAVKWGVRDLEGLSSSAPDLFLFAPKALLKSETLGRRGYFAEALAAEVEPLAHWGSVLRCGGRPKRYALGRYFPRHDPRRGTSALAARLLELKDGDGPAAMLGRAFGEFVGRPGGKPRYVVPVPPKPSQSRNRFEQVLAHARPWIPDGTEVVLDGLRCVREVDDYKTLGAVARAEAIAGAFESSYRWSGRVLLLDDILTSGSTAEECARVLTAGGAQEVRIAALAKDQRVFALKECPRCGRTMKVRTNSYTGVKFWGCSGFPDHCQYTEDL